MAHLRRCRTQQVRTVSVRPAEPPTASSPLEDLRFIRQTLENSTSFTAVPGWGMVLMGATALAVAVVASRQESFNRWAALWLVEAVVALLIGLWMMERKARRNKSPLFSGPGRRFLLSFVPPMIVGAVLTPVLYRAGALREIPGAWLLLYGTAVVTGGAFSVPTVPVMGMCFMLVGGITFISPAAWANWYMAAAFGGLHILFGTMIARRHGG